MRYYEFINQAVREKVLENNDIVLFGQNIDAGSCLSGFTRGLEVQEGSLIINTPNSENGLCAVGFGLLLGGVDSIFFMKQQDFLLLGIDQLVNTLNFIKIRRPKASFTIMNVVVDSGYEGPQSRLNNLADFCSISGAEGFTLTNRTDAEEIISAHLVSPGFRIISVSQRLANSEIITLDKVWSDNGRIFKYKEGNQATIVCFNFSLNQGLRLYEKLNSRGLAASLYSVNTPTPIDWADIIEDVTRTGQVVVMDDSNSINLSCDNLVAALLRECRPSTEIVIKKEQGNHPLAPNPDEFNVDYEAVLSALTP